jgi:hypothetical protein
MPVKWSTQELREEEMACPVCGNVMEFDGSGCCPHTVFVHARSEDSQPRFLYQQPQFRSQYLETLNGSDTAAATASKADELREDVLPSLFKDSEAVVETYTDAGSPYPISKIVIAYSCKKQLEML